MKLRMLVALVATLLVGTLAPFASSSRARGEAPGTDEQQGFHVDAAPERLLQLDAPDVVDPDVKATFTGSLIRDGEPAVEEWVDLMVDGEDMTHAITDENGQFSMETEMWEAPTHTVQAIASRGSGNEIESAILSVRVRPVPPELWGTTVGDGSGENTFAVQGWARENTTVSLFTDVACEFEPVATASADELAAGVPLTVAANTTTKIYANVTNELETTSDCSEPITYTEDSEAPVVEEVEATVTEDGIEVSWTEPTEASEQPEEPTAEPTEASEQPEEPTAEPTEASEQPEEPTAEVCAAEGELTTAEECFGAPDAQIVEAEPGVTSTTITGLQPLRTYTVATRVTDAVGNEFETFVGTYLTGLLSPAEQIKAKYEELQGPNGILGVPTSDVYQTDNRLGYYQNFRNGTIYYSRSSGAHELHGDIREKFKALGGTWWAFPTTDQTDTPDKRGRYNHFTDGKAIYHTPEWGARSVEGPIRAKWQERGWETGYGYPVTDTLTTSNGRGKYNFFEGGRAIYWSPETNAHNLQSTIFTKWASLNYENGLLGFPATDQTRTPDGQGEFVHFQGGSIYYSPSSGTHEIHGPIWDKWAQSGFERGYGYPTTRTTTLANGGMYSHFTADRSIYYSPQTGAHLVYGEIRRKWASMGWEQGALGYPVSDEEQFASLRVSKFQGGSIVWNNRDALYVRKIPVVAVLVSDDDGGRAPTVDSSKIAKIVEFTNTILMKAGVQLTFNPLDLQPYRNTGTNNLDRLGAGSDDVNRWMERNFPNHLGVFFQGARESAWTRRDLRMVFLNAKGGPGLDALAHEVGHWLDLNHTFIDDASADRQDSATDTDAEILAVAGGPGGEWKVDGDKLSDTRPDPGAKYVQENQPSMCTGGEFAVSSPMGWSLIFDPQRKNLMSYYHVCGLVLDELTPQQVGVIRGAAKGYIVRDWRF